jgi:hypothetical protein
LTKPSLALIDPERTEFDFARTICACTACVKYCLHLPGYLIPADLDRIQLYLSPSEELFAWATKYLLASPGALVMQEQHIFRIPTLVPARRPDGACLFLSNKSRCCIHTVAPFGCGFFDSHQEPSESDRRSQRGLQAVLDAWRHGDLYAQVWQVLYDAGLRAQPPEQCRQQLQQHIEQARLP